MLKSENEFWFMNEEDNQNTMYIKSRLMNDNRE